MTFPTWRITASKPMAGLAISVSSKIAASTRPEARSAPSPPWRTVVFLPQSCLPRDNRRSSEVRRHPRRCPGLSEYVRRSRPPHGSRIQRPLLEQSDLGRWLADPILNLRTYTNYSTSDYNGFRPNPNVEDAFEWNSPSFDVVADYQHDPVTRHFKSLEEYSRATRQEQHSIPIDYDVFVNAGIPDKSDPQHLYKPEEFDFRLKPGSRAVDAAACFLRSPTISPAARPTRRLRIGSPAAALRSRN